MLFRALMLIFSMPKANSYDSGKFETSRSLALARAQARINAITQSSVLTEKEEDSFQIVKSENRSNSNSSFKFPIINSLRRKFNRIRE
ncbi:hypothetical protein CONCODRAFT_17214 [Conidiobolus coronatus NRRL 28638]|uniref:Uncharacterized protein n=1 Tax=Conidiobolus coronatus (strain ATCC 28846 / CBS 209.66 / NRRL 28638) TaxID=796925 RepID=A0A137P7L3_CONC2|nr:hypothetical protein CONCODRAFT_17214 [Conidiobolus coronatus NRRL 28638]|eukprot:KXN71003.1 hypothetical protein CONCODRAFT_17214 [Conidiobolus coronatus NRRL 28638]